MTLADQFVARGCQPDDAERQAALVRRSGRQHSPRRSGRAAEWRGSCPGRLEVFGKHTDYAGGDVARRGGAARLRASPPRRATTAACASST